MEKRTLFADWQKELAICATAPLCDIEAGYHGPLSKMLIKQWSGHRRAMLQSLADMMLRDGYPVSDVLDALRAAMGFKQ